MMDRWDEAPIHVQRGQGTAVNTQVLRALHVNSTQNLPSSTSEKVVRVLEGPTASFS